VPHFKIETSLFEPVMIEVEGGRTYESVPLSPFLIREIGKIDEQRKAGTLDGADAVIQEVALIFGLEMKDVEKIDIRLLTQILEYATAAMSSGRAGKASLAVTPAETEATAEKNAPTPEGGISQ
jgi:hypothetical protein